MAYQEYIIKQFIEAMIRNNHSQKDVADLFNTSRKTIYRYLNKEADAWSRKNENKIDDYIKSSNEITFKPLYQYIRDYYYKPIGIIAATLISNNYIGIGVSMCHKNDTFNKEIGLNLAKERAIESNKEYVFYYNEHLDNYIEVFLNRCIKYYKNNYVIAPKIKFAIDYHKKFPVKRDLPHGKQSVQLNST